MINVANLREAMQYWRTQPEIWDNMTKDFPEHAADMISYKDNPNCSCGGRLFSFLRSIIENSPNALDKYNTNPEGLNAFINDMARAREETILAGKIITIEKSERAWSDFVAGLVGKQFHSFSISERENEIAIYFI